MITPYEARFGETFLSSDVPPIVFASKEIARHFHDPRVGDWHDLARAGRWLVDKGRWAYFNELEEENDWRWQNGDKPKSELRLCKRFASAASHRPPSRLERIETHAVLYRGRPRIPMTF